MVNTEATMARCMTMKSSTSSVSRPSTYMVDSAKQIMRNQYLAFKSCASVGTRSTRSGFISTHPMCKPNLLFPEMTCTGPGVAQRWNNMCAECHSTNFQKGFDVKSLEYHSTFSEIDVSCEAVMDRPANISNWPISGYQVGIDNAALDWPTSNDLPRIKSKHVLPATAVGMSTPPTTSQAITSTIITRITY